MERLWVKLNFAKPRGMVLQTSHSIIAPKNSLKRPLLQLQTILTIVVAFFWARVLRYLAVEEARFRIILGVVLIRSLACTQCVPGGLRSGSGVAL